MRRSDFYVKLTTAIMFVAVVSYIGVYVYNGIVKSYETTTAIPYTIEQTFSTQGYVIRTETVLTDPGLVALPIVGEGEKVASGQAIAVLHTSREALEIASEIRALRLLISQLETPGSTVAAESSRLQCVMDLSKAVQHRDFSRLDELTLSIETNIFSSSDALMADLPDMKARLEHLEALAFGIRTIYAPFSGTFSQSVDGYEHINPDMVFDIMPDGLSELFAAPFGLIGASKLVTEFKWYYAAVMNSNEASYLSEGQQIAIQMAGSYNSTMDMLVERIGRREGDSCVVLFSSSRNIHEIAHLRQLRGEVIFNVISGIRVPKEAIHLDDYGNTFMYLQTGVRAERVSVEILIETGDSYLVRDGAQSGTPLRIGSTIIVRANDLFDGKIVA